MPRTPTRDPQLSPAGPIVVVALGASNTAGYGVGREAAYPACIERLLRSRGLDVSLRTAGIAGDTTAGMLARLERDVPAATRVVLFQPGGNDARLGVPEAERERNIVAIQNRLGARGIAVIRVAAAFEAARAGNLQTDGVHFTPDGHAAIADRKSVV